MFKEKLRKEAVVRQLKKQHCYTENLKNIYSIVMKDEIFQEQL